MARDTWREERKLLLNKWKHNLCFDDTCPYYMNILTPHRNLANVLPEEQEEFIFEEIKLFLLGSQTENIRIGEFDGNLPLSIDFNISLDPFIRAELKRFSDILISTATIKICCYVISNDVYNFSTISATVASLIDKKVNQFILEICEKLDSLSETTAKLNNLFREVHTIAESINFYKDIVKTIYQEKLIGGQVLTLLDSKRRHVFSRTALQDLDDIFQAGWKVFASYIGRLVCKFDADRINYEFVIWSVTKDRAASYTANKNERMIKSKFVVVEALCPSFFTKYIDILVRCAEFGDAMYMDKSLKNKKNDRESNGVASIMEDVRNVDWSSLDVATTVRMLVQFSRKESACLLREITAATNVDQAMRDIHDLILKGSAAYDIMMYCIKSDILYSPIDEIGSSRLKKMTRDILGYEAEKHHYFWKYFSFDIEKHDVFELLAGTKINSDFVNQSVPCLFERLNIKFNFPVHIQPIVSSSAIFSYRPVFRIFLQLHVASLKLAMEREEFRGIMPSRTERGEIKSRKYLLHVLDGEVTNLKKKFVELITVALNSYEEKIVKASSIDEYIECQKGLSTNIRMLLRIDELSRIEHIKDILNIVWSYNNTDVVTDDLIGKLEEVQSRERMNEISVL